MSQAKVGKQLEVVLVGRTLYSLDSLWSNTVVGSSSNHMRRIDYKKRSDRCLRPKLDFNLICAYKVLKCKSSSMDSFYRIVGSPPKPPGFDLMEVP